MNFHLWAGLIPKPPNFNTRIMCFLSTLGPQKDIWMHGAMRFSKNGNRPGKKNGLNMAHCSYGHLPVITGYKWDYTFYKWGHKYL